MSERKREPPLQRWAWYLLALSHGLAVLLLFSAGLLVDLVGGQWLRAGLYLFAMVETCSLALTWNTPMRETKREPSVERESEAIFGSLQEPVSVRFSWVNRELRWALAILFPVVLCVLFVAAIVKQ